MPASRAFLDAGACFAYQLLIDLPGPYMKTTSSEHVVYIIFCLTFGVSAELDVNPGLELTRMSPEEIQGATMPYG